MFSSGVPKSGMMEIGIAMVLHDRFSNQAGQASRAIRTLQNDAMRALQSNLSTAYQIGSIGNAAFQRLSAGISEAINYGAEFIDTMVTVKAITEATESQMNILETTALNLGRDTMFSSQEVASGMKYLAMAGNKAEEINNIIKSATYLSGATGLDLGGKGGAADLLTNVMRTFQLEGEDMAYYVGDVLTKATTSANISITDLAASIRFASSDMINLGYKLPEISAAIGTLGNMGIQSSMAGTALANMARYLNRSISDPKYKGYKYLQSIGLSKEDLTNADGTLFDLYSLLTKIKAATANMSPTELNLFTTGVFGVRGNRAAVAMMRDLENFKLLRDQIMTTPEGYSKSITEQRMATISGQLKILGSQFQNFMVAFTKAVQPVIIPMLKVISKWLEGVKVILGTVPGKIIAVLGVIGTGLLGIVSKLMMIKARFRMLTLDSTVTGKNMFATLLGGWRAATMSAREYQAVLMAITAQQQLGIYGNTAIPRGIVAGNIREIKYNTKTGKVVTKYQDIKTGKFVSNTVAAKAGLGAGAALAGGVTAANVGKLAGVGGKLAGVGSKIFRFLGGWPGIIITIISFLPMIINWIQKHRRSTDENTESVDGLTSEMQAQRAMEQQAKNEQETRELRTIVDLLTKVVNKESISTVNLNLNGYGSTQSYQVRGDEELDIDLGLG